MLQHESLAARFREPAPILMRNPNERDPNRTNFTTESGAVVHTDSVDSIDSQDDISRIGVPHEFPLLIEVELTNTPSHISIPASFLNMNL
jgi:hypothetical protein